jgi:hypothetical protein
VDLELAEVGFAATTLGDRREGTIFVLLGRSLHARGGVGRGLIQQVLCLGGDVALARRLYSPEVRSHLSATATSAAAAFTHAITGGWHSRLYTGSQNGFIRAGDRDGSFLRLGNGGLQKVFLLRSLSSPEAAFWRKKSGTCQALVDTSSAKVLGVTKPAS